MRESNDRFPPERQRRFERAFREIERHCEGRAARRSTWRSPYWVDIDPIGIERVRWLLVAMALARATPGSDAIARLARRGYAINTGNGPFRPNPEIVPLDRPDLVHLGHVLPSFRRRWKWIEKSALDVDPEVWLEQRWCSAHATLQIRAALRAEGHIID